MTWKSADEVAAGYLASMGADLGPVFHQLSTELTWIHWQWRQYRILFGDKESRLELLNEASPFFFRIVQDLLFENTVLGIARIAGPHATGPKQNLAVTRLPQLVAPTALRTEVESLIAKAVDSARFAFDWRNRHIAHRDLLLALGQSVKPLEPASRQHVEDALDALRHALNRVEDAYCHATTIYTSSPTVSDAEALLYVIRDGLRMEASRRVRWDRGELHEDDTNPPPPL